MARAAEAGGEAVVRCARRERSPALDGVRGIAILLILLLHGAAGFPLASQLDRIVHSVGGSLWIGVDLFFVLSGYLITGILCDSLREPRFFRTFYLRRTLRIFPLYYAAIAFIAILAAFSPLRRSSDAKVFLAVQGWYWTYLVNVFIARYGWVHVVWGTGHLWSLAVEEQFYLVWPALIRWVDRARLIRIVAAAVVGAPILRTLCVGFVPRPEILYMLTPMRIDSLGIGALIALQAREAGGLKAVLRWMKPAALASGAALITIGLFSVRKEYLFAAFSPSMQTIGYTAVAVLSGRLIVAALDSPAVARRLCHVALRTLGKYSYAMYIVHYPIVYFLEQCLGSRPPQPLLGSYFPYILVRAAVVIASSLGFAWVSFRFFEGPLLDLKETLAPVASGR